LRSVGYRGRVHVLGITETCDLGSLYQRLIADGHEVRVAVSEPLAAGTMAGLVPKVRDWRAELDWVAGSDGLIVFEATGFGALQDQLRADGYNVIGGSAFGDRLEADRGFAQQLLAECGLQVAPTAEFSSVKAALRDLANRPRRCVFKKSASAGETFAGSRPDGSDVAALLAAAPPPAGESFVLMDHVDGVEIGIGAYFDGRQFLRPACLDWEHKRFFTGDMGELTGEMGTVATFDGSDALFDATLARVASHLRSAGHVGYVNLNTIVNAAGIWPLEFTCRFGYPGFAVLEPLQALSWSALFRLMLEWEGGRFATKAGFALCVVLTTPPFPWSRKEVASPVGLPVLIGAVEPEHIHLGEVGLANGQLVTAGLYGWTAVVTGTGPTVREARDAAYRRAALVEAPNLRYRLDIGDKLMAGELALLADWGWLTL
jgi:phosphoribosylamine--glycine ligase